MKSWKHRDHGIEVMGLQAQETRLYQQPLEVRGSGWADGSIVKILAVQAWGYDFDSPNPHKIQAQVSENLQTRAEG